MVDRVEARRCAEAQLAKIEQVIGLRLVIMAEGQFSHGWVFCYDSVQHRRTGELRDSIAGNAPILVDKDTGAVFVTGTAQPIEYYIKLFIEQKERSRSNGERANDDLRSS